YDVAGSGEPLVVLYGWMRSRHDWPPAFLAALQRRFTVIRISARGLDDTRVSCSGLTMVDLAEDCFAAMDAEGVATAAVFGQSMGGITAQVMAWSAPARVRALVLASTVGPRPSGVRLPISRRPRRWATGTSRAELANGRANASFGTGAVEGPGAKFHVAYAHLNAMLGHVEADAPAAIQAPCLVLHGEHDRVIAPRMGSRLAEQIPGADYREVAGGGHDLVGDRPDLVAALIIRHSDEVAAMPARA